MRSRALRFAVRSLPGIASLCIVAACNQRPRWVNESDPLGPAENTISIVESNGYALFFKCWSKDKFELGFVTNDAVDSNNRSEYEILGPTETEMQIRTDNNPVVDLTANESFDDKNILSFQIQSDDLFPVIKAIATASTRVVVGAKRHVNDSKDYVQIFAADGAKDALTQTLGACNIDVGL